MKKKIMIIISALLIGGISAYYLFNKVVVKEPENEITIKAFQIGAFSSYDNAYKAAERSNGIVISDTNVYRVYVALLSDNEAITKLEDYYNSIGLNYYIRDIKVNDTFIESISLSQEMLKRSSSDTYNTINLEILKIYREEYL